MIILDAGGLPASRGTAFECDLADRYAKPVLVAGLQEPDALQRGARWLRTQFEAFGTSLNLAIGGPRESEAPGIHARAAAFIRALLKEYPHPRLAQVVPAVTLRSLRRWLIWR